jgi:hypothetical protein
MVVVAALVATTLLAGYVPYTVNQLSSWAMDCIETSCVLLCLTFQYADLTFYHIYSSLVRNHRSPLVSRERESFQFNHPCVQSSVSNTVPLSPLAFFLPLAVWSPETLGVVGNGNAVGTLTVFVYSQEDELWPRYLWR